MTSIQAFGSLLTANKDNRTLTYRLLPYGEEGRTNVGRVTASAGAVTVPEDASSVLLNFEHDRTRPVGRAVAVGEDETGLRATFTIARTRAGDDLLEEAAEGLRAGVSVELDDPVIRGGRLIGGTLSGAGAVVAPAFPSALLVAADAGDLPEPDAGDPATNPGREAAKEGTPMAQPAAPAPEPTTTTTTTPAAPAPAQPVPAGTPDGGTGPIETTPVQAPQPGPGATEQPAPAEQPENDPEGTEPEEDEEEEADVPETGPLTASAAAGTLAARRATTKPPGQRPAREVYKMLASAFQQGGKGQLLAALADVVPADILGVGTPQYLGELWSGRAYTRRIVPLFNHADLTSFKISGWRWVTKPEVEAYAGNKTPVPSGDISTEAVDITPSRLAVGHDIDRIYQDFGVTEFFDAYFRAVTESYARVSDTAVFNLVETAAGAAAAVGTVPTGVGKGWAMVVDGALEVLNATGSPATFALIAPALYRDMLLTRNDDVLPLLSSALGGVGGGDDAPLLSGFRIIPWADVAAGQVLVGTRDAVTVYELPGATPIRVEAVDLVNGGIDKAAFGYYAVNVHNAAGLALIDDGV